jgi:hypothetical protein
MLSLLAVLARRCGCLSVLFDPGPDSNDPLLAGATSEDLKTVIDSGRVTTSALPGLEIRLL